MHVKDPVTSIDGVGTVVAERLLKLGIETVEDLLRHYPARYEDYSQVVQAATARPGNITIKGEITRVHTRRSRKGTAITEALITDDTGSLQAVWFNQPHLGKSLPTNTPVYVSGELAFAYNKYALQSPVVEPVSTFQKNAARIVPIYPETEKISSKQLRKWIEQGLKCRIDDPLPRHLLESQQLLDKTRALQQIHFPDTAEMAEQARRRLAFEELYILLFAMRQRRNLLSKVEAPQLSFDKSAVQSLLKQLPFDLTDSQRLCAWQIIQDLDSSQPMSRMLQGDVGSGKTVVAALAMVTAAKNSSQSALMAPTEVLATQHHETLREVLAEIGVSVDILTGSTGQKKRHEIKKSLASGELDVIVGTHALLEDDVEFSELGLVVVDEQHRFGVDQRRRLAQKSQPVTPHTLSMTATPIPRSLALTVYGDMDVSRIKELPPGRKPVITRVVDNIREMYDQIGQLIDASHGVFVVCPLIDESDTLGVMSVKSAISQWQSQFPQSRIAGLHGQLSAKQKLETIESFKAGEIDILVSTTVVEVGVDAANAAAMVVEGAERFGLAQLHQLRGRVGRGEVQSYCYLKPTRPRQARKRLKLLEQYRDGARLAQADLELRGPGELQGLRQHGTLDLRLANITDLQLINTVQTAIAQTELDDLPKIAQRRITDIVNAPRKD